MVSLALAAGGGHTCALTAGGGVKCWGAQLVRPTGRRHDDRPDHAGGRERAVERVASRRCRGPAHYLCADTAAAGSSAGGDNCSGQLGDGTTTSRYTPVDVSGLAAGHRAASGRRGHTCALTQPAAGSSAGGLTGPASWATVRRPTAARPVDVSGLASGVTAVAAAGAPHLRATSGRRGQVLGRQRYWPTGRRHDAPGAYAGGRERAGERGRAPWPPASATPVR